MEVNGIVKWPMQSSLQVEDPSLVYVAAAAFFSGRREAV